MKVVVLGAGLHPFNRNSESTGLSMAAHATRLALRDAGLAWRDIQAAYGGSHEAGNADSLVSELGLTGIEFTNVYNGCATGGSTLRAAYSAINAGACEVALAVGFDVHPRGAFALMPEDWGLSPWYGQTGLMLTTQFFAAKIQRYMHDFRITPETLALVAEKNYANGAINPDAWRRSALSKEEILGSEMINHPLTKYMFCSPSNGAAAVIVASESYARRLGGKPVYLRAATMRSRRFGTFEVVSPSRPIKEVPSPSVWASRAAYEMAGVSPADVAVTQLQDTDSGAEIMHMAENHLCEHGQQESLIRNRETHICGRLPINTDGGLFANGEPIGASGLRQVYEICLQLRGRAGARQVPNNPKIGYTHVYGAPGVSAVTILST
jgi:acetyl-CoA C-acetyltransferase